MTTQTAPAILPGLHPGLSRERYDSIDAVNQSSLKVLIERSPAHYRYALDNPSDPTDALRFGQAVHLACYEPARFAAEVVQAPKFDRRTKAGKEEAAAFDEAAAGKLVIDAGEYESLVAIQKAVFAHPAAGKLIGRAGDRELTALWADAETGVLCKGRLDHLTTNAVAIIDLKTTRNASPGSFSTSVRTFGYDVQAAFYVDGILAATGATEPPCFVILAAEKEPPYAVAVYEMDQAAIELGRLLYRRALEQVAVCRKKGIWPGYSDGIEPISVPAWALRANNIPQEIEQ